MFGKVYSVSEITDELKALIEKHYKFISIKGEISNFRPSSTGHYYFSLKDKNAVISAVMFKRQTSRLDFVLQDGQLVEAFGTLSLYAGRGSYQIICESIKKAGEGDILAELEERKKRLSAEGLFDYEKKQEIPSFPSSVAVITSPTGAAIKDILRVLKRRNAGLNIKILPAAVQGQLASQQVANQIIYANKHKLADVLIISRGGGSLEDLLPFSDEQVVRAVAASTIPVISAVGHEIDTSLCDLAADKIAPTPSAAAEIVSINSDELLMRVKTLSLSLEQSIQERLSRYRLLLKPFSGEELNRQLQLLLQPYYIKLDDLKEKLLYNIEVITNKNRHKLELLLNSLESNNPLAILKKGYAVINRADGEDMILSAKELSAGDNIKIQFHDGNVNAEVKNVRD